MARKKKQKKQKLEFSKIIVLLLSCMVLFTTWRTVRLTELAVNNGYTGSLPYLTAMTTAVWGAYGTALGFYFNKAKEENKIKITAATTPKI